MQTEPKPPTLLDQIVNTMLYEGYLLYPYRSSSKKNRRERFTFGRVYPAAYSDYRQEAEPCLKQTECLLQAQGEASAVDVTVRFLHPLWREAGSISPDGGFLYVPELSAEGSWQEATERVIRATLGPLDATGPRQISAPFSFPSLQTIEPMGVDSSIVGTALRRSQEALSGVVEVEAETLSAGVFKITVRVLNRTPLAPLQCEDRDAVIMRTFASTHAILQASDAQFISMTDPPTGLARFVADCKNIGTWPVLVGDGAAGQRDTMLSSPIILYDYPQVAPESAGDFFDGTEIDEMLTLRVLTLTDGEKTEMRQVEACARRLLERTESAGVENLWKLHGGMREVKESDDFFKQTTPLANVFAQGRELRAGDTVRIRPKHRADAIDLVLAGKIAVIEAIEEDAEGRIHLGLVLEDDPGKDLGLARQSGHRFFYGLDEIEPVNEASG